MEADGDGNRLICIPGVALLYTCMAMVCTGILLSLLFRKVWNERENHYPAPSRGGGDGDRMRKKRKKNGREQQQGRRRNVRFNGKDDDDGDDHWDEDDDDDWD